MAHGHWIKKTSLFFSCTTTMLSFRLVISTAGFCVVRFHIDCEHTDIFTGRFLNAALIAHQFGNWFGVISIVVSAATSRASIKLYALAASNWLCLIGICLALICFCAGEAGRLTGFYWSMTTANLFHKTSHAICFEIAPCGEHGNNDCVHNGSSADSTNYCVASFAASSILVSVMKAAVLMMFGHSDSWKQLNLYGKIPQRFNITIDGQRSVKTTVDYKVMKLMIVVTMLLTTLICVAWTVIVLATTYCQKNEFEVDWNNGGWETRVVGGILGIIPGLLIAVIGAVICAVVIGGAFRAGIKIWFRVFKWGVVVTAMVVAVVRVAVLRLPRKRPDLTFGCDTGNRCRCHTMRVQEERRYYSKTRRKRNSISLSHDDPYYVEYLLNLPHPGYHGHETTLKVDGHGYPLGYQEQRNRRVKRQKTIDPVGAVGLLLKEVQRTQKSHEQRVRTAEEAADRAAKSAAEVKRTANRMEERANQARSVAQDALKKARGAEKLFQALNSQVQVLLNKVDNTEEVVEQALEKASVRLEEAFFLAVTKLQNQPGPAGPPGKDGKPGPKGDQGPPGPKGDSGPPGQSGSPGPQGKQGEKGPQGEKGEPGPRGIPGNKGETGDIGPIGPAGPTGPRGPQGEKGPKGDQGERGLTGERGPQGEPGVKGDKGDTGPKGERGEKGPQGMIGPQGPRGLTGPRGPPGDTTKAEFYARNSWNAAVDAWIAAEKSGRASTESTHKADIAEQNSNQAAKSAEKSKEFAKWAERSSFKSKHSAKWAEKSASKAMFSAKASWESAERSEKKAEQAAKSAADSKLYAEEAKKSVLRSEAITNMAKEMAERSATSAEETANFSVEAWNAALYAEKSAYASSRSAAIAELTSAAAMGTSSAAVIASGLAFGTANIAAAVSVLAMGTSNFALSVSNLAWAKVDCGVTWMRTKIREIFGIQEVDDGRRWQVIVICGVVGIIIIIVVVGLGDAERDWGEGEGGEEEVRKICKRASVFGGVLGLIGGIGLGAFAKEIGVPLGNEQYGSLINEAKASNDIATELSPVIGLASGTGAGFIMGIILGACVSKYDSKDDCIGQAMSGGALIGAAMGIITGLIYQAVTGTKLPKADAVVASIFMDIFGLGTVYSIYPDMAPCSITHFQYFDRIEVIILSISLLPPIAIIGVSEIAGYGPEQKWDTEKNPWMWAWYIGGLLVMVQHFCMLIFISVLQNPQSKLAQKVTTISGLAVMLTVTMVTCGQTAAVIGYPGVVGNSGHSSSIIMVNNTTTLTTMEFTAVLGEGYLTELKKYEPGKWPTQGMGKWDSFNWWRGRASRNAWAIWCCICTTDLRRDIIRNM